MSYEYEHIHNGIVWTVTAGGYHKGCTQTLTSPPEASGFDDWSFKPTGVADRTALLEALEACEVISHERAEGLRDLYWGCIVPAEVEELLLDLYVAGAKPKTLGDIQFDESEAIEWYESASREDSSW
jgi:hypothetical protein